MSRTRERLDSYTLELQRHGLESVEREVRWLNELIASERQRARSPDGDPGITPKAAQAAPPTEADRANPPHSRR